MYFLFPYKTFELPKSTSVTTLCTFHIQIQHIELNDQLTEKLQDLTAKLKEEETKAEDFERENKSLNEKYNALEGIVN